MECFPLARCEVRGLLLLTALALALSSVTCRAEMTDDDNDKEQAVRAHDTSLDLSKRPFCNFNGCANYRKRTMAAAGLVKKPFCNGFTGCGNYKRFDVEAEAGGEVVKKPFCNGFNGCGNNYKRSEMGGGEGLELEKGTDRKKRPFCNGFNGCGNGPVKKMTTTADQRQLWARLMARIEQLRQMRNTRPY